MPCDFYYYLSLFLAVECIIFELWYFTVFKSIKKASIFNKNYKDKNEQHFQILKVLFLCGILGGLHFNTRLNWKRAFRSKTACRGVRVSGGDLCTKCRSTDRAGRRDQVLLPLPKRNSHRFGDCFFFVRQNLSSARACRASSPSAAGGRCSEARMAQRSKRVAKQLQVLPWRHHWNLHP